MKTLGEMMEKYLEDKEMAWAESTLKSERHRLNAVLHHLDGNPKALWDAIKPQASYSRLTTWIRISDFWDFCIKEGYAHGPNEYRTFKKKCERHFKYAYQTKTPEISFEEAKTRIETLEEPYRGKALQLLCGGLRYGESFTVVGGKCIGKGGKPRKVFVGEAPSPETCYRTFLRRMAGIGLKPHTLRKICATELARQGMTQVDLCKVMGWSSFDTAKAYLAPLQDEAIAGVFNKVQGGTHARGTKAR